MDKLFPRKEGFGETVSSLPAVQARNEALERENSDLKVALTAAASTFMPAIKDAEAQRDTAWDDAVEAAAQLLDARASELEAEASKYRGGSNLHHEFAFRARNARSYAANIRDLKRGAT